MIFSADSIVISKSNELGAMNDQGVSKEHNKKSFLFPS